MNERQIMLLKIAIQYIENTAGIIGIESIAPLYYDEAECDGYCLAEDLKIEFELED